MRTVLSNHSEVAHTWAHKQQAYGESGNIFFKNNVIYSYGYHFPVACHVKDHVLFTLRDYSVSTSKHKGIIHQAIPHRNIIYCKDVEVLDYKGKARRTKHKKNIEHWVHNIQEQTKKLGRARKPEIYIREIGSLQLQMQRYIDFFRVRLKKAEKEYLNPINKTSEITEKIKKREDAKKAEELKKLKKAIKEFREFKTDRIYSMCLGSFFSCLRFNAEKDVVETSQGVIIERKEAERAYAFIQAAKKKGYKGGGSINNIRIDYIHDKEVKIGCHRVELKEVENVYKQLKRTKQ